MKHRIYISRVVILLLACVAGGVNCAWAADVSYKLTQVSRVKAGGLYVFEQSGHVMSNTISSNALKTTATYQTTGLAGTEAYVWKLETASGGFYMRNVSLSSSSGYLNNTGSTTNVSFGEKSSVWTFAFTDDVALISNNSSDRFLGYTTPTSYAYRAYADGNQSIYPHAIVVYKLEEEIASPLASIALSGTYPTVFTEGSAFSHDGMTVTATYEDGNTKDVTSSATFSGYDMSTPGSQTVTVSYTESDVTATATYSITVNALPTHTVTWSINGSTTEVTYKQGAAITFPADPEGVGGKTFVGWTESIIAGTTDVEPTFVTSATMGDSDKTFYAVFADVTPGDQATVTDDLTASLINQAIYGTWSGKSHQSSAVYAGNSTTSDNDELQIRNTDDSGIVTTTSGGNVRKITVVWGNVSSGRTLDVYGKNTAYSSAADLYSATKQGTKLGSIVCGTSTELQVAGDYAYVGLCANNAAMWFGQISITWENGVADSYSGYCTNMATAYNVTITPAKYATFSAPQAVDFSATGITVYTAKADGSVVRLTAVPGGIVPAGTGVILYKNVAESQTVSVPVTESTASLTDNELVATLSRTLVGREGGAGYNYILQSDGAGGIVFNMATAEGAYMPAGRAYLSTTVDASAPASRLSIRFDDVTTGVAAPGSSISHSGDAVYSLQGQRCSPRARGIYIKGGKKHVVR